MVSRAKKGDAEALEQMYRTFAPKMRATCRHIMKQETAVTDDLLHDAFVLAYTSLDQLQDSAKLEMWLCAIARNVALRYLANQQNRGMKRLEGMSEHAMPQASKSQDADAQAMLNELLAEINTLPHGYRDILRLHVLEGYSHEEIGLMLGIAPHSSSSQLSRAKAALRRMMKERRMWCLMALALMAIPTCKWFLRKEPSASNTAETNITTSRVSPSTPVLNESTSPQAGNILPHTPTRHRQAQVSPANTAADSIVHIATDSTHLAVNETNAPSTDDSMPDSIGLTTDGSLPRLPRTPQLDYATTEVHHATDKEQGWRIGGGGLIGSSLRQEGTIIMGGTMDDITDGLIRPTGFSNWEDYHEDLLINNPHPNEKMKALMNIAANNSGDIVEHEHHQRPITVGITLSKQMTYRWSIVTWLQYSLLKSTFSTGVSGYSIDRQQRLNYLGIPLQASYQVWTYKRLSIQSTGEVTVNVPLHGSTRETYVNNFHHTPSDDWHVSPPWQWSCCAAISMQYEFAPRTSLYIEPTFNYYIPNGNSTHSIWTERPFCLTVPLGVRITW